jgi:hypothetical protein
MLKMIYNILKDWDCHGGTAMKALYCLSFDKKTEWIDDGRKLVENQLGTALLTFLVTDFKAFLNRLAVDGAPEGYPNAQKTAEGAAASLRPIHPFLENAMLPMYYEADKHDWLVRRLQEFLRIQGELSRITDAVLLVDGSGRSVLQRLCMLLSRDKLIAAKMAKLGESMRVERCLYVNGRAFEPLFSPAGELPPPERVTSRFVVGSDDLEAVLLTELEEMAEQNIRLKKCAYCGGYFQPFSLRTIYCDRLVGQTGKTCKELAAKEKYEKKIAADEGLSLYQRRNKAYAMRVSRAPEIYRDADYQTWKAAAETAIGLYADGKISLETLDAQTRLPEKK